MVRKTLREMLKLDRSAFSPEESGTLDAPETYEGLERFALSGGEVLEITRTNGFLQKISLEDILKIQYEDLPDSSPLKQIAEKQVLQHAKSDYSQIGKEPWYIHGIGTVVKGIGDGKILLRFYNDEIERTDNSFYFGYIDIDPTKDNINIASFRLFLGLGAVIDGYEAEVYSKGVPYLRVSHGANYELNMGDSREINLSKRNYKDQIRKVLDMGYIGTELILDSERNPQSMVFYKRLNK